MAKNTSSGTAVNSSTMCTRSSTEAAEAENDNFADAAPTARGSSRNLRSELFNAALGLASTRSARAELQAVKSEVKLDEESDLRCFKKATRPPEWELSENLGFLVELSERRAVGGADFETASRPMPVLLEDRSKERGEGDSRDPEAA